MTGLLFKELRQLSPIGFLWLAVIALSYLAEFLTARIDEESFQSWCEGYCDPGTNIAAILITALFALVTAWSLFPREHDESTIDFLRALPVSRATIFVAKIGAAWLLLCLVIAFGFVLDIGLLSSNPESIGGRFYPQVWWTLAWRDAVFVFVILAYGTLLSWFRTTGLVLFAVYLLSLAWLESQLGSLGHWSLFSLVRNEYDGSALQVDGTAMALHVGIALLLLLCAYRLWSRTESGPRRQTVPSRFRTGMRWLLGSLAIVLVALGFLARVEMNTAVDETIEIRETDHYRFAFAQDDLDTAEYLITHADADLGALAELLGVEVLPDIRVDLSARSEHAAGLASWKQILMDLSKFASDRSQRRVLSHESAHVLQATESDRALARNFAASRFFVEGMAQYTSFHIVPEAERRRSNWEIAAMAQSRQRIRFRDLIDIEFGRRFDPELYYSLGDLWTHALVDVCGQSVLGDVLRAVGRESAPRDASPMRFWRDAFDALNCDLERVNAAWQVELKRVRDTLDPALYPRFEDIRVKRDSQREIVEIDARLVSAEPGGTLDESTLPDRFLVRIASDTPLSGSVDPVSRGRRVGVEGEQRVRFDVPLRQVPRARFRFQLGYAPYADSRYFYSSWQGGHAP